jgi:oxygen-independent coproporphyrinogen-3 oxidase
MAHEPIQAVYVHVPFCSSKCGYCAFYSLPDAPLVLRKRYLGRLADEAAQAAARCGLLQSVYVGGGTPSYLDEGELERLLALIRGVFELAPQAEFSVECNPDSLTPAKVEVLLRHGVNRVSLGIQSFDAALRRTLGRAGSLGRLDEVLAALRSAGVSNVGADLIYAIPGQSLSAWRDDLRRACELGIAHLSTYEWTVEEGGRLAGEAVPPVDEERALEMWHAAGEVAGEHGLARYEVSNLAKPGLACRHNDAVWHGGAYLGLGPAAASYDGTDRWTNQSDLTAWLEGGRATRDVLPPDERAAEVLGFGLRTVRGWTAEEFRQRTRRDYMALRGRALARLADGGLLKLGDGCVRPTERGLVLADYVARTLL